VSLRLLQIILPRDKRDELDGYLADVDAGRWWRTEMLGDLDETDLSP
jgi:hypothetical protein